MDQKGVIVSVSPRFAIAGGEVLINCDNVPVGGASSLKCLFGDEQARIIGASSDRLLAIVPEDCGTGAVEVVLEAYGNRTKPGEIFIGKKLAGDLHQVANPAIDPNDGSIILTRSGTRGQSLSATLFRLEPDGFLSEMSVDVLNPTGLAFDSRGQLFVTNRADGEVLQINSDTEAVPLAVDLGVATGLAFDKNDVLFVGDRNGTIHRIAPLGDPDAWAFLEPSVSAYHMAFGPGGGLYVTAPGLCSHDSVYRIAEDGSDTIFFKGLGRPQGLAFDDSGDLYVAACLKGRHGIVKISGDGESAEMFAAGMGIVGLCFSRKREMIVATGDSVFSIGTDLFGTLLD